MSIDQIQKIEAAAKRDPLVYGITYVDLLQGQSWDLETRKWSIDIYDAVNPHRIEKYPDSEPRQLVLMKPTQIGMSTMAIVRIFHFADFWPSRIIYMLPRQQDYIDFVTTRIDPMIAASKRMSELLDTPDSTRAKGFKDSYIFFMESTVEPRMMPADMLMVDEIDLCYPENVATAINRLDNSSWKIRSYFGTPTIPNYGSHGRYLSSNKNVWKVKCPGCGKWQELEWDVNLRVIGNPEEPDDLFIGCSKCNRRFTVLEINEYGRWVPENPDQKEVVGYHISQLMTFPIKQIYANWLDPEQTIVEFYRKRLGKPYEIAGGSISREDILATCFVEPYQEEFSATTTDSYYMGVDQGNELQVLVAKREQGSDISKIVHIELVPYDSQDGRKSGFERIGELMNLFKIRKAVIDGNPNRHPVRNLQKEFPGRIVIADYVNIRERMIKKTGESGTKEENTIIALSLNRTLTIDNTMQSIREGLWRLYGNGINLPPIQEIFISQVTALKRDVEVQKKPGGLLVDVAIWRKLRPEHFAHSLGYLNAAIEITSGGSGRIVVIGGREVVEQEEENTSAPSDAVLAELLPIFSQVRQEQAQLFMGTQDKKNPSSFPQPLRQCLERSIGKFDFEDILWVLMHKAMNDNKPIQTKKIPSGRSIRIA